MDLLFIMTEAWSPKARISVGWLIIAVMLVQFAVYSSLHTIQIIEVIKIKIYYRYCKRRSKKVEKVVTLNPEMFM